MVFTLVNRNLISVDQFPASLTSLAFAFSHHPTAFEVPATLPAGVTSLRGAFHWARTFNGDISGWDVSNVTDMSYMFNELTCSIRYLRLGRQQRHMESMFMKYMFVNSEAFAEL